MKKNRIDDVFEDKMKINNFVFDKEVSQVFDDMVNRSVPFYQDVHKLISNYIAFNSFSEKINILDLGCSTGTLLKKIKDIIPESTLSGIDSSDDMLKKARQKIKEGTLIKGDILEEDFGAKDVIILSLILQFIRPMQREKLLKKVHESLYDRGIVFLFEKVKSEDNVQDRRIINLYHNFKEDNDYSKIAIRNKRESLENVLIPYTTLENIELLKKTGFNNVELLFKYLNFSLIVAVK